MPQNCENGRRGDHVHLDQNSFILLAPPEGFPLRTRKVGTCGHHSLKAVVEAKNKLPCPVLEYSPSWLSRKSGFILPWGLKKMLRKYDIAFKEIRTGKLKKKEKIGLLKEELKNGPLLLLVANGLNKNASFSFFRAFTHWHYITLWGYDDTASVFFVYDSNTRFQKQLETRQGMMALSYNTLLKMRSIGASKLFYNYALAIRL